MPLLCFHLLVYMILAYYKTVAINKAAHKRTPKVNSYVRKNTPSENHV